MNDFSVDTMYRKHDHDLSSRRAEILPGPQDRGQGLLIEQGARVTDDRQGSRRGAAHLRRVGGALHCQHGRVRLRIVEGDRVRDQRPAGAAGRLRRALGARRSAPGVQRLVLHRAASGGDAGPHAGARLHHRDVAASRARSISAACRGVARSSLYLVYHYYAQRRDCLADGRRARRRRGLDLHREPRRLCALVRLALRHRLAAAVRPTSRSATRR